jgi:hypothetical protein
MKIEVLRNLGADLPKLSEGEIADVDDATAKMLIDMHLAKPAEKEKAPAKTPPARVQAVPPKPAVKTEEPKT